MSCYTSHRKSMRNGWPAGWLEEKEPVSQLWGRPVEASSFSFVRSSVLSRDDFSWYHRTRSFSGYSPLPSVGPLSLNHRSKVLPITINNQPFMPIQSISIILIIAKDLLDWPHFICSSRVVATNWPVPRFRATLVIFGPSFLAGRHCDTLIYSL